MLINAIKLKSKKVANSALAAVLLHFLTLAGLYLILWATGLIDIAPTDENLVNWDVVWYQNIKDYGYQYYEGQNNSMAFYPLFPFVWRLTGFGPIGISIFNITIFYSAFFLIARHLSLTIHQSLLYLTTPSLIFCFVPYTEALYFLGGVILIIGMDQRQMGKTMIGILICGFSRSIAPVLFIPIVYSTTICDGIYPKTVKRTFLICGLLILVTLLVYFIQYLQSGYWWVFFEVQKSWNRQFRFPTLPFTTLSGRNILWLDGLALLVCIFSLSVVIKNSYLWLRRATSSLERTPSYLFSSSYLALIGIVSSFYSGNAGENLGTSLYSINRFVFASPFFIVFLHWVLTNPKRKEYGIYFYILLPVIWLLLGVHTGYAGEDKYSKTPLYFIFMTCLVLLYATVYKHRILYYFCCLTNFSLQVFLYSSFLHGRWIA